MAGNKESGVSDVAVNETNKGNPDNKVTKFGMEESSESLALVSGRRPGKWRNVLAYWILGLCNNYGYVVMLSAAHDVLSKDYNQNDDSKHINITKANNTRDCNEISTGVILLADILPSLIVKVIAPFLPFFVHVRIIFAVLLTVASFVLVALAKSEWMVILGVAATSLSSGLGELTFLAYTSGFDWNAVPSWSSGTGGAGVFGALSYAGLTALKLDPRISLLIMLVVPVWMAAAFWLLLEHPKQSEQHTSDNTVVGEQSLSHSIENNSDSTMSGFFNKLQSIPSLLKYMIPLCSVYLFEYFINQGLFELIDSRNSWLDHVQQYRWMQLIYQVGVFISRSSGTCITFKNLWMMAVFQFINVILFTVEVIFHISPSIWITFAFVLWEGFLGGAAYVNTYNRISAEVPEEKKKFSMSIVTLSDAVGIGLAGAIAIPVHNIICQMPLN